MRKVKVEGACRFLPVWKQDGRYNWAKLKYKNLPIVTVEGTFYLHYTKGKRVRRDVGDHALDVKIALSA